MSRECSLKKSQLKKIKLRESNWLIETNSAGHYGTNFMFVCMDLLEAIFRLKNDSGMILMKKIHGGNF